MVEPVFSDPDLALWAFGLSTSQPLACEVEEARRPWPPCRAAGRGAGAAKQRRGEDFDFSKPFRGSWRIYQHPETGLRNGGSSMETSMTWQGGCW